VWRTRRGRGARPPVRGVRALQRGPLRRGDRGLRRRARRGARARRRRPLARDSELPRPRADARGQPRGGAGRPQRRPDRRALGGEEGEALLREAVDVAAESPARIQHARALVDLGAALRRGNKRAEARDTLRRGAELAYRSGTAALVERANQELAATGARPRKEAVGGVYSLTASERRVAELAAQDKSNKEIAQALFVTVKTVEVHLSSVYRKLALNSGRQLAAALSG